MILTQADIAFSRVEIPPLTQYRPCNPSVVVRDGFYYATVRGCNYDLKRGYHFTIGSAPSVTPDSQNYLAIINKHLEVTDYWFLEDRHIRSDPRALDGLEDLRLFEYDGEDYVLASALHYTPTPKNTMVLCKVDGRKLRDPVFIQSPKNATIEKNWMPLVKGRDLYFVYKTSPFELYRLDGSKLVRVDREDTTQNWPSGLSGSSCVMPYEDGYMAVLHRKTIDQKKRLHFYRHHLVEFDSEMKPVRFGRKFSFEDERIEFCAGLAFDGPDVLFSYGLMDQKAVVLRMSKDSLRRLF
jgi:hypothetical protein